MSFVISAFAFKQKEWRAIGHASKSNVLSVLTSLPDNKLKLVTTKSCFPDRPNEVEIPIRFFQLQKPKGAKITFVLPKQPVLLTLPNVAGYHEECQHSGHLQKVCTCLSGMSSPCLRPPAAGGGPCSL